MRVIIIDMIGSCRAAIANAASVGFVGFGRSNRAVYEYLSKHYAKISFTLRASSMPTLGNEVFRRVMTGEREFKDIDEDILFLSPSVRRDRTELIRACERGTLLSSDTELFLEMSDADVFAVSGSDGKSTVTYLSSKLLEGGYDRALPCGNYGEPLSGHIDDEGGTAYCVELSSFQLMYTAPKCRRSLLTNITENHLDWHSSFEEYICAKKRMLENSSERIFSADCGISRSLMREYPISAVFSSEKSEAELLSLGAQEIIYLKDDKIYISGKPVLDTRLIRLRGEHNIQNFMAALGMSLGYTDEERAARLATEFGGLPHRCELVCESNGIKYINSSIDSTPLRTARTIASIDGDIILILGGRSKGLSAEPLITAVSDRIRFIFICGENCNELTGALRDSGYPSERIRTADSLDECIDLAMSSASINDTVLLSPASTSHDSFSSFEERGVRFKNKVKENLRI